MKGDFGAKAIFNLSSFLTKLPNLNQIDLVLFQEPSFPHLKLPLKLHSGTTLPFGDQTNGFQTPQKANGVPLPHLLEGKLQILPPQLRAPRYWYPQKFGGLAVEMEYHSW